MWYRIRNFFIISGVVLAAYLLQYSVFIRIPVINCAPNMMLMLAFAFGYVRNKNAGMLVGFFAGLLVDVFYCQVIGFNALMFMLVGFVCGALKKVYYSNSVFMHIFILCMCDIVYDFAYYFFWFILQSRFAFKYYFVHVMVPEFCFTLVMGIILIKPLTALIRRIYLYRSINEADSI